MIKKSINAAKDSLFKKIHNNNLIYNTCWEDPRLDKQMMNLNNSSKVVMITSAGCNALSYVLDNPDEINCIDVNLRQNALLELKKALFSKTSHKDLFKALGRGRHEGIKELYASSIRDELSAEAQAFWDEKLFYFHKKKKKSFYFYGTAGTFAWIFKKFLDSNPTTKTTIRSLIKSESLKEQNEHYSKVEKKVLNKIVTWAMNRHITMSLLGVPRPQRQLIIDTYPGGISGFLKDQLRHIFTELPIQDNYFWHLYIYGRYSKTCCPEYLEQNNFEVIKGRLDKIKTHTTTISEFLKNNPGEYTHFVLLDHQDWLAAHDSDALEEEWNLILKNAAPGAKIIMRSASLDIDFLPKSVYEHVVFDLKTSKEFHVQDRVGTYGCTYFGEVKSVINHSKITKEQPVEVTELVA